MEKIQEENFIANFRRVLNVVFILLGDSPASEFYVPTFRNTVCSIFKGRVSGAVSSPSHTYYRPPLGVFALHSLFLYSDTAFPRSHLLPNDSGYFEPNLYLYKYSSNVVSSDPRYKAHLLASHRSEQKGNCPKNGYTWSPPEHKK
jgi:hypothetical protein